jgi:hypothetical protein
MVSCVLGCFFPGTFMLHLTCHWLITLGLFMIGLHITILIKPSMPGITCLASHAFPIPTYKTFAGGALQLSFFFASVMTSITGTYLSSLAVCY